MQYFGTKGSGGQEYLPPRAPAEIVLGAMPRPSSHSADPKAGFSEIRAVRPPIPLPPFPFRADSCNRVEMPHESFAVPKGPKPFTLIFDVSLMPFHGIGTVFLNCLPCFLSSLKKTIYPYGY